MSTVSNRSAIAMLPAGFAPSVEMVRNTRVIPLGEAARLDRRVNAGN